MNLFNSNLPMVIFVIIIIEISLLYSQWIGYLSRPYEDKRKYHSLLLLILILFNLAEGIFPDPKIPLHEGVQNFLGYSFGYIFAAYCPHYFYKTMGIPGLSFHGKYGPLFILVPLFVCYGILYPIHGDIQLIRKQVYIVPAGYAIVLYWVTFKQIFKHYKINRDKRLLYECICIYMAVFPVCITPILGGFLGVAKWIVTTTFNVGFLIVNAIFMKQLVRRFNEEHFELKDLNTSLNEKVKQRTLQIEQANERQRHTFNNLIHETKTPLTLVNNYLDEFIETHGEIREISVLKGAVNKLTHDMISLMDIEKFNRGIAVYRHNQILNFSAILKESWALFEPYIKKQQLSGKADIQDNIYIKADPHAINRVINNLIDNAIKFTESQGTISVSLNANGKNVEFIVCDAGIGISLDQQKKIFEPYYQINHETSSRQGMGLGLPIVKKVIDELGGMIAIRSDPTKRKGTEITISLKLHIVQLDDVIISKVGSPLKLSNEYEQFDIIDSSYKQEKQTILLVEDNQAGLSYLSKRLKKKYNVYHSLNGSEALKFLKKGDIVPDLIISDVMMDKVDGFSLAKALSSNQSLNHIPLIFLTAKSSPIDKIKGLGLGAVDWMQKPYSFQELELRIEALLDKFSQQQKNLINNMIKGLKIPTVPATECWEEKRHLFDSNCRQYGLSKREIEVAWLAKDDLTAQEIADKLNISPRTVTTHFSNIFNDMKVNGREGMVAKLFAT